ncbi:MAG: MMPL family transporter [Treponema sp.]|nr:MMPL family transporter [Treponema sp.]
MNKLFKHPFLIVAVIALITVFFALQLPRAELDNNNFRFVPDSDPARLTSKYIDDTFGSSLFILVGLEREYGTVFDGEFLNRLRDYVQRIEELPTVDNINSLISTDYISGDGESIIVEKLVGEDFSGSPAEIAELKTRLLSWDTYERSLISDDFSATQVLVPLDIPSEDAGKPEVIESFVQIRDIAREMFDGLATVYVTGMPVISATVNEAMSMDLTFLVPLVIVVVLLVLFFSFRGFTAVILPLLTVIVASIWSVGAMPLFGFQLSVISTVLPVILVAVGSAYGIHVITHYITDMGNRSMDADAHRELIFALLRKIGKPVFLAALTTFVGFASFIFTTVSPIREFGYFSSFGVVVSFVAAVTLIPSLLIIRGPKPLQKHAAGAPAEIDGVDPLSGAIADTLVTVARKKRFVMGFTVIVLMISLYGLSKLVIDNIMMEYFRPNTDINKSDVFIREKFGGSKVVSVVLEADDSATLLSPSSLSAMDGLAVYLQKVPQVGKVMGFTDLVKRINQVFNAGESPDGLKSTAQIPPGQDTSLDDDFGFGFDDDSGFGDFGFGDFDSPAVSNAAAGGSAAAGGDSEKKDPAGQKIYTENELIALFDRAGGNSKSMNANDLVRELKRQVNYQGASYYEIPADPRRYGKSSPEELQRLVSNYLVLLSGNIDQYANDPLEPTAVKLTIQLRTLGQADSDIAINKINEYIRINFPPEIRTTVGGVTMVEASLNHLVVQSQLISVIISILMVFIIITVSNKSFIAGCIGIAPLSISILINFAVMGFAGIKLNIGTSMVASVSVGIGIDYTIHYLEAFKREYRASGGTGEFLRKTFTTSGKAIIINAVSVGAGFAVLLLSRFNMLADLGLLIALTMGTSALVSLTVLPVLLTLINPKFICRE